MWRCVAYLIYASFAWSHVQPYNLSGNTAWGYIEKYGIPRAKEIQMAEENRISPRIVGGVPAGLGQYPFQAGLIGEINGTDSKSACGGSLISSSRVLTAAHCWNDGRIQVWRLTVVLGSITLFSGGTRVMSTDVTIHPDWTAPMARNDVAIIYLPDAVTVTELIAPVALPTGSAISEDFVNEAAIAVGFGVTDEDEFITVNQTLNHVRLKVISNGVCSVAFPFVIQPTHICTSGMGGTSTCSGDSGGPLLVTRDNKLVQIGISSFVHALGCKSNLPAAFTRVTKYLDFIGSHLK